MGASLPKHDTWNSNVNMFVPSAHFSADIDYVTGEYRCDLGALVAVNAAGILNDASVAAVATFTTLDAAYSKSKMGPYGRNVTVVASGVATSTLRVNGRDYLGQPMSEDFTLNGATPVPGKKAFRDILNVQILTTTAATTIDVGWGDVIGLPYRTVLIQNWLENGVSATAGTLVAGASASAAQTGTSADPRGTADFNSASNGAITFSVIGIADLTSLHGAAHYSA